MRRGLSILAVMLMLFGSSQLILAQDRNQVISDIKANLCNQTDDNCYQLDTVLQGMNLEDLQTVSGATTIEEFNSFLNPTSAEGIDFPQAIGDIDKDYTFTPVTPCRIVDTRNAGGMFSAGQTRSYYVHGTTQIANQGGNASGCTSPVGEPRGVMINITAYPYGSSTPNASVLNYRTGVNISNASAVKTYFAVAQDLSIYSLKSTHLVIDVLGYYAASEFIQTTRSTTSNYNTSLSAGSEAVVATCLANEYLTGGTCSCYSGEFDSSTTNSGTVFVCEVAGNHIVGACTADYGIWDDLKYGPPITVHAICISTSVLELETALEVSPETLNAINKIESELAEREKQMMSK